MPTTTIYVYGLGKIHETTQSRLRNALPAAAARIEGLTVSPRKVIVYLVPDVPKSQEKNVTIRVEGLWHGRPIHDLPARHAIAKSFGEAAQEALLDTSYVQCKVVPPFGEPGTWESKKL